MPDNQAAPLEYEATPHAVRKRWTLPMLIGMVGILVVAAIVLPPRLIRTHDHNPRVKCATQLRQLGLAAIMYANLNNMKMPDDLQTLFDSEDLYPDLLVCPSSNLRSLAGATTQAADTAITSHQVSYVYLGKGLTLGTPADTVLMYEPLGDHGDGINVLFVDSHVEWLNLAAAKTLIARIGSGQHPIRYPDPAATQP